MQGIALSLLGCEDVLAREIEELGGTQVTQHKGCCIFSGDERCIATIAYYSQSAERVGLLLRTGTIKDPFSWDLQGIDVTHCGETFGVGCTLHGEFDFKSNDIILAVSDTMRTITQKKPVYKGQKSQYHIALIDTTYYFFLDSTTQNVSKRDYKVFVHKSSLRGTIAYAVARLADIKKTHTILDPFARSGEIPIEIAHFFLKKSLHTYAQDKFFFDGYGWNIPKNELTDTKCTVFCVDNNAPNVKAAEKNAKIAGVHKKIQFSRILTEDLDLKFDTNVDRIVTQLPALGKETEASVQKTYDQFFYVCPKVLAPQGTITCIGLNAESAEKIAHSHGFKTIMKRTIMQGKEAYVFFQFAQESAKKKA